MWHVGFHPTAYRDATSWSSKALWLIAVAIIRPDSMLLTQLAPGRLSCHSTASGRTVLLLLFSVLLLGRGGRCHIHFSAVSREGSHEGWDRRHGGVIASSLALEVPDRPSYLSLHDFTLHFIFH